ncbi:MAG: hypothetical protein ABSG01_08915 [Anaerolineales bacterium]|jgi:hypothetical protein
MEFKIPKITAPLDLGGYSTALAGQCVQVWINPPLEKRRTYWQTSRRVLELDAQKKRLNAEKQPLTPAQLKAVAFLEQEATKLLGQIDAWISEIWSQGAEETHVPAETVHQFRVESADTDPQLFGWMVGSSLRLMMEHQGTVKKG